MLKKDRSFFVMLKTDHFQQSGNSIFRPSQRRIALPLSPPLQYDYKVSIPSTNERMNRIDQELREAAIENNLPEVSRLLSVGADVNATNSRKMTPLHKACYNGHVQVVVELLEHGADIEAKDNTRFTPLHWACYYGHVTVVNELRSRRANIEAKTNGGSTPLHLVSCIGHVAIVQALLSGGANILAVNNEGNPSIHAAVNRRRSAAAKCLLQHFYATTRRLPLHELLEDLTWIGNPYSSDAPPLHTALHRRNMLGTDDVVEILEYLVDRDPTLLRSRDPVGSLPLHVACHRGASFAIVQSLVNLYKASVKSVTSEGDLPLFLACEMPQTYLDTIFLLMKLYPDLVYR
jgi:ankyrin repeat protein